MAARAARAAPRARGGSDAGAGAGGAKSRAGAARAVAAALEAARRDARRAEKSRKARLALGLSAATPRPFPAHAGGGAHQAAGLADACTDPRIDGPASRRRSPPRRTLRRGGAALLEPASARGLSAAPAALGASSTPPERAGGGPGRPLDPRRRRRGAADDFASASGARRTGSSRRAHAISEASRAKLVDARVGAAKLSRECPARRPETHETSSALLSPYASRPFAVAEAGGDALQESRTRRRCGSARGTRETCPPRRPASAALFVLRPAPARRGAGPTPPGAPERGGGAAARVRVGLVRVGGDQARAFGPRLASPRAPPAGPRRGGGFRRARRRTRRGGGDRVRRRRRRPSAASGTWKRDVCPVRVDHRRLDHGGRGLGSLADAGSVLWARRNDALADGLRWMASVAPSGAYFRAAYLRDEVRDAPRGGGGTRDAPAATSGHASAMERCCRVRARALASAHARAPSGLAAEFAEAARSARSRELHRGGALAENDAAARTRCGEASGSLDAPSGATPSRWSGRTRRDPSGLLGAVAACSPSRPSPARPRRVSEEADPAARTGLARKFREIFAAPGGYRTAQKAFARGPRTPAFVGSRRLGRRRLCRISDSRRRRNRIRSSRDRPPKYEKRPRRTWTESRPRLFRSADASTRTTEPSRPFRSKPRSRGWRARRRRLKTSRRGSCRLRRRRLARAAFSTKKTRRRS